MELHIYQTSEETITGLADFIVSTVTAAIARNGACNMVLSGGNSPKKLYELLASPSYAQKINWYKVYFFFGDERYVPFTDKENNGLMAKQTLFDPFQIDHSKIFYINTALSLNEAVADYEQRILYRFDKKPVQFDLVLLGLGDNAHTASLFPHTPVLYEMKALVSAVFLEEQQTYRITMTAPLINEAHTIAFLVYGEAKAEAVYQVLRGAKDIAQYPAQLIESENGTEHWFLDQLSAQKLA